MSGNPGGFNFPPDVITARRWLDCYTKPVWFVQPSATVSRTF